jgi:hypothetical protein
MGRTVGPAQTGRKEEVMNTIIENLVKQTVAVVLAALITVVIANSISQLAGTDITGKTYKSDVSAVSLNADLGTAAR